MDKKGYMQAGYPLALYIYYTLTYASLETSWPRPKDMAWFVFQGTMVDILIDYTLSLFQANLHFKTLTF